MGTSVEERRLKRLRHGVWISPLFVAIFLLFPLLVVGVAAFPAGESGSWPVVTATEETLPQWRGVTADGEEVCLTSISYVFDGVTYGSQHGPGSGPSYCDVNRALEFAINPNNPSDRKSVPMPFGPWIFFAAFVVYVGLVWLTWWGTRRQYRKALTESPKAVWRRTETCGKHAKVERIRGWLVWPLILTVPAMFFATGTLFMPCIVVWVAWIFVSLFEGRRSCPRCAWEEVPAEVKVERTPGI